MSQLVTRRVRLSRRFFLKGLTLLLAYRPGEIPTRVLRIDLQSGRQRPWKDIVPQDRTALTLLAPIRFTSDCETYAYSLQYDPSTLFVMAGLRW